VDAVIVTREGATQNPVYANWGQRTILHGEVPKDLPKEVLEEIKGFGAIE
jgi:hypothetical protein